MIIKQKNLTRFVLDFFGTRDGTRTRTAVKPADFKSAMSTIPSPEQESVYLIYAFYLCQSVKRKFTIFYFTSQSSHLNALISITQKLCKTAKLCIGLSNIARIDSNMLVINKIIPDLLKVRFTNHLIKNTSGVIIVSAKPMYPFSTSLCNKSDSGDGNGALPKSVP